MKVSAPGPAHFPKENKTPTPPNNLRRAAGGNLPPSTRTGHGRCITFLTAYAAAASRCRSRPIQGPKTNRDGSPCICMGMRAIVGVPVSMPAALFVESCLRAVLSTRICSLASLRQIFDKFSALLAGSPRIPIADPPFTLAILLPFPTRPTPTNFATDLGCPMHAKIDGFLAQGAHSNKAVVHAISLL